MLKPTTAGLALSVLLASTVARAGPTTSPGSDRAGEPTLVVAVGAPCVPGEPGSGVVCASERRWFDSSFFNLFGVRASVTRVSGQTPTGGATLVSEGSVYGTGRYANVRMGHIAMLGAGPDGVEGGIGADYAAGVRAPLGRHHGPFARVGLRGHLLGDSELYSSMLEVPDLQLGYQYLDSHVHAELGARGGAVLVGRYIAGGGRRALGDAPEYGGYATLRWEDVQLDLDFTRVALRQPGSVDSLAGALCSVASPFGICVDARWYRGDVEPGGGGMRLVASTYVGLAVGGALRQ